MRNLVEYPITSDEVISALECAHKKVAEKQGIGDINAMVIYQLEQWLIDHPDTLSDIVESMKI